MSGVKKISAVTKGSLIVPATGGYIAELGKIYVIKSEGYDEIKKDKSKKKLGRGK